MLPLLPSSDESETAGVLFVMLQWRRRRAVAAADAMSATVAAAAAAAAAVAAVGVDRRMGCMGRCLRESLGSQLDSVACGCLVKHWGWATAGGALGRGLGGVVDGRDVGAECVADGFEQVCW